MLLKSFLLVTVVSTIVKLFEHVQSSVRLVEIHVWRKLRIRIQRVNRIRERATQRVVTCSSFISRTDTWHHLQANVNQGDD